MVERHTSITLYESTWLKLKRLKIDIEEKRHVPVSLDEVLRTLMRKYEGD